MPLGSPRVWEETTEVEILERSNIKKTRQEREPFWDRLGNDQKLTLLYFIEVVTEFHEGQAFSPRSPTVSLHALADGDHLCWWVASSTPCV